MTLTEVRSINSTSALRVAIATNSYRMGRLRMSFLTQKNRTIAGGQDVRRPAPIVVIVHNGEDGHDVSVRRHESQSTKRGWKFVERYSAERNVITYVPREGVYHVCCDGAGRSGSIPIKMYGAKAYQCTTCEQKWIPVRNEEGGYL